MKELLLENPTPVTPVENIGLVAPGNLPGLQTDRPIYGVETDPSGTAESRLAVYACQGDLPPALEGLELPNNYALKGGAARAIAAWTLFGEQLPVRDVDLVLLPSADDSRADEFAAYYAPQDLATGYGVDRESSIGGMLRNRDFTMNEVAVIAGEDKEGEPTWELYFTPSAYAALRDKRVALADEWPGMKMKLKARLFAASLQAAGFAPTIDERLAEIWHFNPFWVGVMLDRAAEQGPDVVHGFWQGCNDAIGYECFTSPDAMADWVLGRVDAYFPNIERYAYGYTGDPDGLPLYAGNRRAYYELADNVDDELDAALAIGRRCAKGVSSVSLREYE